jgi:phosphate transport system substrate-binding protein
MQTYTSVTHNSIPHRASKRRTILSFSMLALLLATLLAACGANTPANSNTSAAATSGDKSVVSLSGAFALVPMVSLWADKYKESHPNVDFDIQAGGAGKGMTDVLAGAVDIAMVSRSIKAEEIAQGAFPISTTVDTVVGTFNAKNPHAAEIVAKGITPEIVNGIWISNTITTWGQYLGNDASDTNGDKINVYTRSDSAGAADQWAKFGGGTAQADLHGTAVDGDPGVANAVIGDPLGVGFNNIGFAYDPTTLKPIEGLAILPIDLNGDGTISGDEAKIYETRDALTAAIAAKSYPWPPSRVLYLVTKGQPTGATLDFIQWVLSDEGQGMIAGAGYVQLTPDELAAAKQAVGE